MIAHEQQKLTKSDTYFIEKHSTRRLESESIWVQGDWKIAWSQRRKKIKKGDNAETAQQTELRPATPTET